MRIEVLFIEDCPSLERLMPHLHSCLNQAEVAGEPRMLLIRSDEQAKALRFLGSPTVRVDGLDAEPGADAREDFGLKCRLYRTPQGLSGLPPDELILAALSRPPA